MNSRRSRAERELHPLLSRLAGEEAPGGWIIAVIKADLHDAQGAATVDYIEASGHVIWHEPPLRLREALHQAIAGFRGRVPDADDEAQWSRAAITLSRQALISADFWGRR